MIILGIETSCDDTGIAIIKAPNRKGGKFNILSNIVSSQIKVHQKYGGVVPNLAAREHLRNIEPCLKKAFSPRHLRAGQVDLIAVTIGPGLIPSLLIGVHFAKALAYRLKKPIIGINHIEGHIIAALGSENLKIKSQKSKLQIKSQNLFPAICLVVSGGHTQLILMGDIGDYKILGETRDDAAGECFDKVAKLLRLGYPGGPAIAKEAAKVNFQFPIYNFQLPRPMITHKNYDFSFSGLKTAVLYMLRGLGYSNKKTATAKAQKISKPQICAEVQQAIIDVLIEKTLRAAKEYKAKTVILSGGVAANNELRKQFESRIQNLESRIQFFVPPKNLCTDNAVMIAVAGYFHQKSASQNYNKVRANANLRIS